MRLALKVVLATVLGTLVVLIAFGWLRARQEIRLFDSDMRKDHGLIGATLGVCVASTWAASGPERALELIDRANADRPGVRIGWVHADGRQNLGAPVFQKPALERLTSIEHAVLTDPRTPEEDYLVTRIPVRDEGRLVGAVEIAESLDARDNYVASSIWNTIFATLAMVVMSGVVVLVLGVWLVGRPLRMLTNKAKRVGQGDLSEPLPLVQRDEIGELAGEVNAMCERLAEADAKTKSETAARIKALEQLRHADRLITVGRLAAGIAHELGTPLNVIVGRVKMLRRDNIEPAVAREYLSAIAEQADRINNIIRQLMDFARRREPKVVATDLSSIARSIARLVEPIARKAGVSVGVSTTKPVLALGDAGQIEQVLSNLVVNAIHACSEGGRVEIACEVCDAGTTCVRVSDDGHGMTKDTLERIFEPFFTTKDVGQGTGLGLCVAHGIVEEHSGSISVESTPGKGSIFSVFLPIAST